DEIKVLLDLLFQTYSDLHEPVLKYVKENAPYDSSMNESAWKRAAAARRFDAIRYLLPTCTKTSLGWTINARQLAHAISKLLSHPLKEMQELGLTIKEECSKVLPSLLLFTDKSEYLIKTEAEMPKLTEGIKLNPEETESVKLVKSPTASCDSIIASILYKYKQEPYECIFKKVQTMSNKEKEEIFDNYLKNMGKFDAPLRELEHGQFTFDIVMDYGAFRDLQRHRICTQTNQLLKTNLGYDIPKDIVDAGCETQYTKAMDKAKEVYEKVAKKYPLQAQYLLPLGFRKRFLITMNLRELHHFIKIRTTPMAHESYRLIAFKMYEIMKQKYPILTKYIHCSYECEELGRLKSEERTEKKTKTVEF
ncbi:MAG: FAD-dependent thymidylate synthase, partial [Nanoarchaeota archaeon]|nr:FAD-dependent thymidylate synthase [Nanoarchaeota archaeon]